MSDAGVREWVAINGRLVEPAEARVSVYDTGFLQGLGLFETMRAYAGRVFRMQRHLDRLVASARAFGWTIVPDAEELAEAVAPVLEAARAGGGGGKTGCKPVPHGADLRVRVTVTPGSLLARADEHEPPVPTVVVTATTGGQYSPEIYEQGALVLVSDAQQNPHDPTVGHKTTSYLARLAALRRAHVRGAFEALWLTPDRHLAEGCISNVFVVREGQLLTPPLDTPVLPGITRAAVLELAADEGLSHAEQTLTIHDLLGASEVFLTNSMMTLVPVVSIERHAVGDGKPGALTRRLLAAYRELVVRETAHG